ncbi:hypothetical protein CEXT_740491 [Caerostris extrusa]|uniref:Uncharacterized protein n=1 Tax=Caerostris extrusa TaxID=172846 RepID=A0AAV4YCY9_CAEEX|nr:hypothetical protein CEXT_740491 [Caerostris extrusa]
MQLRLKQSGEGRCMRGWIGMETIIIKTAAHGPFHLLELFTFPFQTFSYPLLQELLFNEVPPICLNCGGPSVAIFFTSSHNTVRRQNDKGGGGQLQYQLTQYREL